MGHETPRHHIGAVADPRCHMPDRRRRNAEPGEIVEPGNPGFVAPDPGIVEDRRRDPQLRRGIGGINPAMRAVDDHRTLRLGTDAGDAVGDHDRCGLDGHRILSREKITPIMQRRTKRATGQALALDTRVISRLGRERRKM